MDTDNSLSTAFATPVIWVPDPDEWEHQIDQMLFRAYATDKWLHNEIETDVFCSILDETGVDLGEVVPTWEQGLTLL